MLTEIKEKDIIEEAYRFRGKYPKYAYQQFEFTLERLKKLAK